MKKKTYGPYRDPSNCNRQHVVHIYSNGKRIKQMYSRFLMEQHLGRRLEDWEQIDHINNDPSDDRIENLQILTQLENNIKSIEFQKKKVKWQYIICPSCGILFNLPEHELRKRKRNKSGPYCSRSCARRKI